MRNTHNESSALQTILDYKEYRIDLIVIFVLLFFLLGVIHIKIILALSDNEMVLQIRSCLSLFPFLGNLFTMQDNLESSCNKLLCWPMCIQAGSHGSMSVAFL